MQTLMRDHNAFGLFMMKIMGSRVLQMEKCLESLVFKDSRTRIIEFLYDLAQEKGIRSVLSARYASSSPTRKLPTLRPPPAKQ